MQVFLGCSGFYYNHWKGLFYPDKLPKTQWLQFYTTKFNTVEVNSTFYRFPTEKLLRGWYNKTPADFKFTVKANRLITHTRKFHNTQQTTSSFYKTAKTLKEKLACVLFQLPPFMHKNLELLQTIADQMDAEVVNVLEFRHESWWCSEVYDFLRQKGLVFCSVSSSDLPEALVKTADPDKDGLVRKLVLQYKNVDTGRKYKKGGYGFSETERAIHKVVVIKPVDWLQEDVEAAVGHFIRK